MAVDKIRMELHCKDKKCKSVAFSGQIVVGPSGELAEKVKDIPGEYFTCCECFSKAVWVAINE